jgi:hypothetical protein
MFANFDHMFAPIHMVAPIPCNGGTLPVAPIGEEPLTSFDFADFADFFMSGTLIRWCKLVSSTNVLVQYEENQNVSRTLPIRLNVVYSYY